MYTGVYKTSYLDFKILGGLLCSGGDALYLGGSTHKDTTRVSGLRLSCAF